MNLKLIGAVLAACALAAACGKKDATTTSSTTTTTTVPAPAPSPAPQAAPAGATLVLGSAVGPDKKVTAPKESFGKTDTIYVAVDTNGTGPQTLKAKWTYIKDGQTTIVKEDTQTITAAGPSTNEFHISKPDGWPAGDYQVEVSVNDQPVATKRFVVL